MNTIVSFVRLSGAFPVGFNTAVRYYRLLVMMLPLLFDNLSDSYPFAVFHGLTDVQTFAQ